MTNDTEARKLRREQLACAKAKLEQLPPDGCIRRHTAEDFLEKIKNAIENEDLPRYWPPFFRFLVVATDGQLRALECDLNLVLKKCAPDSKAALTRFLRADAEAWRIWHGGLFDVWIRRALLRQSRDIEFDAPLPNSRDSDVRLKMGTRWVRLENTVLTLDDEWRAVWDRYRDAQEAGATEGLMRPGRYDPPNAKGPSPYYDVWRLYAKVYEKAAKNLDPDKSQFADDEPNVLLVSFCGIGGFTGSPGYGWALDELFAAYRHSSTPAESSSGVPDISLDGWFNFTVKDLYDENRLSEDTFNQCLDRYSDIMNATRRIGGVICLDGCRLAHSRINYNAHTQCALSHTEMADLESALKQCPDYDIASARIVEEEDLV